MGRRSGFRVVTPQFEREDGRIPASAPRTREAFEALRRLDEAALAALGLRPWDEAGGLMLFPAEWFDAIPEGFLVESIGGDTRVFSRATASKDRRFGVLAYGIRAAS